MSKKMIRLPRIFATNRLWILLLILSTLLSSCNLPANQISANGVTAWLEFPVDGQILPDREITFVVYATDPSGISGINIKVNGQTLPNSAVTSLAGDGSSRLVRLDQTWLPSQEGEYIVEAIGANTAGASASSSAVRFCIVSCDSSLPIYTSTWTPTLASTFTATPTPKFTETSTPTSTFTPKPTFTPTWTPAPQKIIVSFTATHLTVDAGYCSTLSWNVTDTATVYLDGDQVATNGTRDVCHCEAAVHTLRVVKPDGTTEDHKLTINVNGSCDVPPPPSDTTGPSINAVYMVWEGCTAYGQSTISDPSGVSWAEFWYNLNDYGWVWIKMNDLGSYWESQVGFSVSDGINTPSGTIKFKVRSLDTLSNESWSSEFSHSYLGCGQ